jgi:hypothetical protein
LRPLYSLQSAVIAFHKVGKLCLIELSPFPLDCVHQLTFASRAAISAIEDTRFDDSNRVLGQIEIRTAGRVRK